MSLDNFATGYQKHLDEAQVLAIPAQWANFHFIRGKVCDLEHCRRAITFPARGSSGAKGHSSAEETASPFNQVCDIAVGERTRGTGYMSSCIATPCRAIRARETRGLCTAVFVPATFASQTDIGKVSGLLGYRPLHRTNEGLENAMQWYVRKRAGR